MKKLPRNGQVSDVSRELFHRKKRDDICLKNGILYLRKGFILFSEPYPLCQGSEHYPLVRALSLCTRVFSLLSGYYRISLRLMYPGWSASARILFSWMTFAYLSTI